jgi:hypothetical protein
MKRLILVLIIFIIFALVGYQLAILINGLIQGGPPENIPTDVAGSQGKQFNVILIHVDRLDRPQPRFVSAWYISLYLLEGAPPTLSLVQIYPYPKNPGINDAFERSFSLTRQGDLSPGFWKTVKTLNVKWQGFLLIDDFTVQNVMEWTNGPGDYPGLIGATQNNREESERVLKQMCQSFGGIAKRGPAPFALSDLIPAHFRLNLRMEDALLYWNQMTTSKVPIICDVLVAPDP